MDVRINETGKIESLVITDRSSGVNWAADLVGNAGAFDDGQFVYDDDAEIRTCDQATFDWWRDYIAATERADDRVEDLAAEFGRNKIRDVVASACDGAEFSDIPSATIAALDEFAAAD